MEFIPLYWIRIEDEGMVGLPPNPLPPRAILSPCSIIYPPITYRTKRTKIIDLITNHLLLLLVFVLNTEEWTAIAEGKLRYYCNRLNEKPHRAF